MKLERIISDLRSKSKKAQHNAMANLAQMGRRGLAAAPDVLPFLDSPDESLRHRALVTYSKIATSESVEILRRYHSDAMPLVRALAAALSSQVGDKASGYPVLREMLRSTDSKERQAANAFLSQVDQDFHPEKPCAAELGLSSPGAPLTAVSDRLQTTLKTRFAGAINVFVCLCDGESSPTARQSVILEQVRALPSTVKKVVKRELMRRLLEEDDSEDADEELEVEFTSVVIPPLRDAQSHYFFLLGDSDYDVEHGFACLVDSSDRLCFCPSDLPMTRMTCDDVTEMERLLSTEESVQLT